MDFPLSVRSRYCVFYLAWNGEGAVFLLCFLPPFLEKGILDFIAHGSIIRVFVVVG